MYCKKITVTNYFFLFKQMRKVIGSLDCKGYNPMHHERATLNLKAVLVLMKGIQSNLGNSYSN